MGQFDGTVEGELSRCQSRGQRGNTPLRLSTLTTPTDGHTDAS